MSIPKRRATPEEEARMEGWVRWSYERQLPVVLWVKDQVLTAHTQGRDYEGLEVQFLQKEVGNDLSHRSNSTL